MIPHNGRVIQNIIQGADLVMSHITHFYHLSALDFINTTNFPGRAPWMPSYTASDMLPTSTGALGGSPTTGDRLVLAYVTALSMRRKMHTAGALFSGRQPIQNALVPGGVTTLLSSTYPRSHSGTDTDLYGPYNVSDTKDKFKALLTEVRNFIDLQYIPNLLIVGQHTPYSAYWQIGRGCGNMLSYGDYPLADTGTSRRLVTKRGLTTNFTTSFTAFDQANIREYVAYSYYDYPLLTQKTGGLHPFNGVTTPNMGSTPGYSWGKSPRYLIGGTTPTVMEVGPLARMVVTHAAGEANQEEATSLHDVLGSGAGTYKVSTLITTAVGVTPYADIANLFSPLGRHAARAIEAKYIADLMADWVEEIHADEPGYTYKKIPKQISTGYGLTEAPRGALGHWIKIEGRKVAKYQCVVPTTWNVSPKDHLDQHGPIEQSVIGNNIGADSTQQIVNILRLIHPFDICVACTVHVVNPEGNETLKFAIDPDGRPKNVEIA